jgi:hypothetical protein
MMSTQLMFATVIVLGSGLLSGHAEAEIFVHRNTNRCGWLLTEREAQRELSYEPLDDWYSYALRDGRPERANRVRPDGSPEVSDDSRCRAILAETDHVADGARPCEALMNSLRMTPATFAKPICENFGFEFVERVPRRKKRAWYARPETKTVGIVGGGAALLIAIGAFIERRRK